MDLLAADLMGDYLDQKYCCSGEAESSYQGFWSGPIMFFAIVIAFVIYWKADSTLKFIAPLLMFTPLVGMFIETEDYVRAIFFAGLALFLAKVASE
jgi:hypothetical protein